MRLTRYAQRPQKPESNVENEMSDSFNMQFGGPIHDGLTIKNICGCRVVYGPVPASDFGMLAHGFSKKALLATDIADRIGASFVIGEPANLEELRRMELPVSGKRHADYQAATELGLHKAAMWLRTGERGASSNSMCKHIFGVSKDAGDNYPHDPDDLRRCILFLDAAEAHDKVPLMASVSPQWAGLVRRWGDLVATFKEEMAAGKSAPKTYAMMREAIGE